MATIALRRPRLRVGARTLELAPLILGLVGLGLGWAGSTWDVAWHRALGRDTFWSTPHVAMYIGTTLVGISSLVAIATAWRGRQTRSRELAIGPLHVERSLALVGFGALTIISAAPLDDLWHNMFGRDVDIWSPPHLVAVGGAVLAYCGWAAATALDIPRIAARWRTALAALFLGGLVGTFVFGMNFYYVFAWSREALLYPVIVCATIPFALAAGEALLQQRFASTIVALAYTALNLVGFFLLSALGWPPAAFAPLVVAGALAVDVVRMRTRSPLALGLAFAGAFILAEGLRLVITAPLPSPAVLSDRQVGHIATQYWAMAQARPWLSAWPLLAFVLGAPLAAGSLVAGRRSFHALLAR
jgi:hypothetical protein